MSAPWLIILLLAMAVSVPVLFAVLALAGAVVYLLHRPAGEYLDEIQRSCRDSE